jgi:Niemann-Pick C1 protein
MFAPSNLSGKDKLKDTLKNTVSSVFIGIGLTKFTGVLVLAFAKSTLFRLYYFRMYLGIVFLGLFNGLMVLPIVLYRLSPYMSGSYSKTVTKYFDTKGKTVLL